MLPFITALTNKLANDIIGIPVLDTTFINLKG